MSSATSGDAVRWNKIRLLGMMQLYGQGGLLAFQFLAVPSFLMAWGSALYGEWLILTAIPLLIAQLNVGFGSAAAPIIARALHDGRPAEASAALLAAVVATSAVVVFVAIVAGLAWLIVGPGFAQAWHMRQGDVSLVLGCGLAIAGASLFKDDIYAGFYAADRQPTGDFLINTMFLFEGALTLALLFLKAGPGELALALAVSRVVLIAGMGALSFVKCRNAWRWRAVTRTSFSAALHAQRTPALGYFLDPVSAIIQNSGVVFVAGALMGPVAAVTMHSHRLLGRISWQATAAIRAMTVREVLRFYALADMERVRHSTRMAFSGFFLVSVACLAGLIALGPVFADFWLVGKLALDMPLFVLLVVSGFLASVLMGLRAMLQVDNRHAGLAKIEFGCTLVAITLIALLFTQGAPLWSAAVVLIALYGLCLAVAFLHMHEEIGIAPLDMLGSAVTAAPFWLLRRLRQRRARASE